MFQLYCPGFASVPENGLGLFVGCVYSYQTLIAGILAILAAYFAARPVWRQVKDTSVQTMINQRETLFDRLNEAIDRFQRVGKEMDKTVSILMNATWDPAGDPVKINDNTAHGLHSTVAGKLNWYLEILRETEAHEIEVAKAQLHHVRKELENTLATAYWPAANDQSGEDYSLTNEQWQKLLEDAEHAKTEVSQQASAFASAWYELRNAQSNWEVKTRQKIASFDNVLSGS
jgi:hypothetical protein